jgi:branched-chain amino acid transport system permease protein
VTSLILQALNGLAGASTLFLVACGLSLIFGVTRVVNFAHGSFYMLGLYAAYSAVGWLSAALGQGPLAFWGGIVAAALAVAVLGAAVEFLLLRRVYGSPELFQLLATFGVMLVVRDAALWLWGPEDLLGPRAPGLAGSVQILGASFPQYDLFLIVLGPAVLGILWLALHRTRWGTLVRAATADREMAGALGVNQGRLFTGVFALGAFLAGLGGGLQLPREPAQLFLDITVIADAFVVVVVGGMGSIPGAFLAALLIGEIKAFCVGLGDVSLLGMTISLPKLTLVAESLVMAVVLIARPWGLLGRPVTEQRGVSAQAEPPLRPAGPIFGAAVAVAALALVALPLAADDYTLVLAIDIFIFALFAASLHLLMGPAGMASFGHAAYFGLGSYGAALLLKRAGFPMEAALLFGPALALAAAAVFGWFCVRLSGVYLAMLTLAFAQIAWSAAIQWDTVTGGSNGIVGVWPSGWLASRPAFYIATLVLCAGSLLLIRRLVFAPYGYALRACRDAPMRAEAIGIDVDRFRWSAFIVTGGFAGVAGALYAFSKGSLSPETLSIGRSVDALVMVLLGGLQSLGGPILGAALFTGLQDALARHTEYWRGSLGVVIIALAIVFPHGVAGVLRGFARRAAGGS